MSKLALGILKNQGYDVTGVYMKCFVQPDMSCMKEAMDAMGVAKMLDIPFEIWDFQKEYKKRVIDYMVEGYRQGLTPNPDIECNREIKFGLFLERALKLGADYVATGHYVRTRIMNNELGIREESTSLFEAKDKNKDQSYFLWTLGQKQLGHALFPVGDYLKSEVREIARKAGLPTAEKKDSQGICFVGKVTLDDFLKEYLPEKRGEVFSVSGEKLGEHNGAHFYTIGQRQG
ncbi:MAG: tRNA-specific 2-thiouridylase, partial [Parcubacteria group bacterium Gr01-1014_20]